jgi:hypothetical protein
MPNPLPRADERVLEMFRRAATTGGEMPTNSDICHVVGAKSVSHGPAVLARLEADGHIKVTRLGRNGRMIAAADGSWWIANRDYRAEVRKQLEERAGTQPARAAPAAPPPRDRRFAQGPRRTLSTQEAAPVAPVVASEAPSLAADGNAARDNGGEVAAGASPAAPPARPIAAVLPIVARGQDASLRADQAGALADHFARDGIQHLRAQIAAVGARAGARPPRSCCFPLWPHGVRAPAPSPDWDPARDYGPGLFCHAAIAVQGRSYCDHHHRITHNRRADTEAA